MPRNRFAPRHGFARTRDDLDDYYAGYGYASSVKGYSNLVHVTCDVNQHLPTTVTKKRGLSVLELSESESLTACGRPVLTYCP